MLDQPLKILLPRDTFASIMERARAMSPRVEFIYREDTREHPELLRDIEISLGGLRPELWPQMPKLRWVQTEGAGVDWMMAPQVQAHPAILTNVHIHAGPIAEHLFALLLTLTRKINLTLRNQLTHTWAGVGVPEVLAGKTLGIIGVGTIGRRTAEVAQAFGLRVLGMRRSGEPDPHVERMYTPEQKAEMLPQCDYLMLTIPLTRETRGFIGAAEFALLKPGALIFNIGRGKTIDTAALLAALQSGHLGGAGLDVTDPEPLPPDHPLWEMPNVVITPHNAGTFPGYLERIGEVFLDNLRRYLAGEPLTNVVEKTRGY